MDICKFKFFTSAYPYIQNYPMPMGYVCGAYINLQKYGMENSWMP
jgi:hypothetical protein